MPTAPPAIQAEFDFGAMYDVAAASLRGSGPVQRPENQDNFLVVDGQGHACHLLDQLPRHCRLPGWPAGHGRVAVLDGMGGHGHGREAAEALVTSLLTLPPCHGVADLGRRLDVLHAELQRHFAHDPGARPGTTLTLVELPPGAPPLLYHVGDSRLYEIGPEHAHSLTVDHVPATAEAMAGRIDERGWWRQVHGRHAPQIAQAFILGNAFGEPGRLSDPLLALTPLNLPSWLCHLPDRRVLRLRQGAVYLLATDGFWSCAAPDRFVSGWPALLQGATDARGMLARLFGSLEQAPPPGLHPDNLTALVLRPLAPAGLEADETALPDGARSEHS